MRKILATALAVALLFSQAAVLAQAVPSQIRHVLLTAGEITSISQNKIGLSGKGDQNEIVLNVQDSTYVVDAANGTPVSLQDLKKGDAIAAYYGSRLTRSMPPQGNAVALVVGKPEKGNAGMYMKVAGLSEGNDGSIRVLCTNGDRLVTITPSVFAGTKEIKEGSELIVWYDVMTASLPGQATATKAVLLAAKADLRVHTLAGVIVVNGKELALNQNDTIKNSDATVMLPLATIAEELGYQVIWHQDTRAVELRNGPKTMLATIGSNIYSKQKMVVQLNYAPAIVNGKTLVPVEFFTEVMGLTVEINNSHI